MLKIGITGGIGSGKSLICSVFKTFDIPVYLADHEAKRIYEQNKEVQQQLINNFGPAIYLRNGKLNREKLARIIFRDKNALQIVTEIIHPVVHTHFIQWIRKQKGAPYALLETAILFESGIHKNLDWIIAVTAPLELRIKRVMERDHVNRDKVKVRIENQMPEKEMIVRSNYIIQNDETKLLLPQILEIHTNLCSLSEKKHK